MVCVFGGLDGDSDSRFNYLLYRALRCTTRESRGRSRGQTWNVRQEVRTASEK